MPTDYSGVNGGWPTIIPPLTAEEAKRAAKRLYRRAMKKPFTGTFKITSGNRINWVRRGVMSVNPGGHHRTGWADLVHDLSHFAHSRLNPNDVPHSTRHWHIERDLVSYVVKSGFLDGKLKPTEKTQPTVADLTTKKLASVQKRLKTWESKRKRAETALRKLRAEETKLKRKL